MNDPRRTAKTLFLFVALLIASGAFSPLWTDTTARDVIEGGRTMQVLWSAAYAIVLVLIVPRWRTLAEVATRNKALAVLISFSAFSAAWSSDPAVTLRKSAAILCTSLLGVLLALEYDGRRSLNLIAGVLGFAAFASLAAAEFFPSYFSPTEYVPNAVHGVFSHKNLLGRAMALGTLAFLSLERHRMRAWVISIWGGALCIAMLLVSHSQTAFIVLLLMLLLTAASTILRMEWRQALGSALILAAFCIPVTALAVSNGSELAALLHRDTTLTGRSHIWDFAVLAFTRHPLLGYGYGAFWWVAADSRQTIALLGYPTPNAHNGFLDIALQLGALGLALFAASWFVALRRAVLHARRCADRWPLLFLIFLALYSLTETSLLVPNSLLWILYVSTCATVSHVSSEFRA